MDRTTWSKQCGPQNEESAKKRDEESLPGHIERFLRAGIRIGVGRHQASQRKALQGAVYCVFPISPGIHQGNTVLGVA